MDHSRLLRRYRKGIQMDKTTMQTPTSQALAAASDPARDTRGVPRGDFAGASSKP